MSSQNSTKEKTRAEIAREFSQQGLGLPVYQEYRGVVLKDPMTLDQAFTSGNAPTPRAYS